MSTVRSGGIGRHAGQDELGIEKIEVEGGIVNDEQGIAEKVQELVDHGGEDRLVAEKVDAEPMNGQRFRRHVALGINVAVKARAGRDVMQELDAADLNDAVAGSGRARSFPCRE